MFRFWIIVVLFFLINLVDSSLVGYDIEKILSTQVYSLLPSDQCIPSKLDSQNITRGALVLHAPEVDIELQYCLFKASYTVGRIAHSARFDDIYFVSSESRIIPTYYPLQTWICRSAWAGETFTLPGFGKNKFELKSDDLLFEKGPWPVGVEKDFRFSANFRRGGNNAGVEWAWPVHWEDPLGNTIWGNVYIEGQLIMGKMTAALDRTSSPYDITLTDHFGQVQTIPFPGADFSYDSTVYLPTFHGQCLMKMIHQFSISQSGYFINSGTVQYLSGHIKNSAEQRVFYVELLNDTISLCHYNARRTSYTGVYFVQDEISADLPEVDFENDAIPNLVYGTKIEFVHANAHLSRQRIVTFIKTEICKTRHMLLNGLISLASNLDNPNLFVGSGSMIGIHAEKAGAALYVHKCAKVAVKLADFGDCTEEVPVIMEGTTEIRFLNPITQVVYPNFTLAPCDPIFPYMYKTVEGLWMHYGAHRTPAREPSELKMFSEFTFQDNLTSLHTAGLFTFEDLRKSSRARILKYSRRTISGREVFKSAGGKYAHPKLHYLEIDLENSLETLPTWNLMNALQNQAKSGFEVLKDTVLTIITIGALIGLIIFVLKVVFAIRLVTRGVPVVAAFEPLNPFDHFTRIRHLYFQNQEIAMPEIRTVEPIASNPQSSNSQEFQQSARPTVTQMAPSAPAQKLRIPSYLNENVPRIS